MSQPVKGQFKKAVIRATKMEQFTVDKSGKGRFFCRDRWNLAKQSFCLQAQ